VPEFTSTDEMVQKMVQASLEEGVAAWGDPLVLTAGIPFGSSRSETNLLKVHVVGESAGV
jgi:pyruvate kinase